MNTALVANQMKSGFRSDINGLRAWAVVIVVLYHFGVIGFSGGFQGVDIFFVISGFLMTSIIVSRLEASAQTFSIRDFYLARAKRIIPALLVVLILVMLQGWWTLPAPDYQVLAKHAFLSLLFLSNFKYWREAGYFDVQSHDKWLLHTWSLSVEWQFYIVFPVLVWLLWKIFPGRRFLTYVFVLLIAASLGLSSWQSVNYPSTAFFLLPSRAWELLCGGLVYLFGADKCWPQKIKNSRELLSVGGMFLVALSVFQFSENDVWPGWSASLVVVGSMLIIWANAKIFLTENRLAQWLGERSYSIYLWHWPLVVILFGLGEQDNVGLIALGVLASLIFGEISYRFVEVPSRNFFRRSSGLKSSSILALSVATFVGVSAAVIAKHGIYGRIDPRSEALLSERNNTNSRDAECHMSGGDSPVGCVYGGPNIRAIVMGDSHANAIVTGVAAALPDRSSGVVEFSYTACPVLLGAEMVPGKFNAGHQCFSFVRKAIEKIDQEYKGVPLIVINRWAQYAVGRNEKTSENSVPYVYFDKVEGFSSKRFIRQYQEHIVNTMCKLAENRKVYVLGPVPELKQEVPSALARKALWGRELDVTLPLRDYKDRQSFVLDALNDAHSRCGVEVLDPTSILCSNDLCHGAKDGHALYYDDDHLNEYGNKFLTPLFATIFNR